MRTREPTTLDAARDAAPWLVTGSTLLVLPAAALSIATAAFFYGDALSPWQGAAALACALVWSVGAARALHAPLFRTVLTAWLVIATVAVFGAVLCAQVYDLGFDSQSYHEAAIGQLAGGWNPIRGPSADHGAYALFIAHYSIGTWVQAALVLLTTHDVEAAKVINVAALAASFCLCRGALTYTGLASRRVATLVAFAAAFNPISVVQSMTFYVDGYLASTVVSLVAVLLLVAHEPRRLFHVTSGAAVVLLANTKFTGAVYALPLLVAAAALVRLRSRSWQEVRAFAVANTFALAVGVAIVGFHPYVTNTLGWDHPFYPLRGPNTAHHVADLRPFSFRMADGRVERLARSLFANPAGPWRDSEHVYKLPFTVTADELAEYGMPDARVGGWGPLFSGALVLAAIGFVVTFVREKRVRLPLSVFAVAVVASALLNSECWWARFAPQLTLLPIAVAVALVYAAPHTAWLRRFGGGLLAVSLANVALVVYGQLTHVPERSAAVERFIDDLAVSRPTLYVADRWVAPLRRLREHGVAYVTVKDDGPDPDPELQERTPCAPLKVFPGTMNEIRYCTEPAGRLALGPR